MGQQSCNEDPGHQYKTRQQDSATSTSTSTTRGLVQRHQCLQDDQKHNIYKRTLNNRVYSTSAWALKVWRETYQGHIGIYISGQDAPKETSKGHKTICEWMRFIMLQTSRLMSGSRTFPPGHQTSVRWSNGAQGGQRKAKHPAPQGLHQHHRGVLPTTPTLRLQQSPKALTKQCISNKRLLTRPSHTSLSSASRALASGLVGLGPRDSS